MKGRLATCKDCGKTFFYYYNHTHSCPHCGSTNIEMERKVRWRRRWVG